MHDRQMTETGRHQTYLGTRTQNIAEKREFKKPQIYNGTMRLVCEHDTCVETRYSITTSSYIVKGKEIH